MEKVIVFGVGRNYRKHIAQIERKYDVVALVDNNWKKLQNGVQPVAIIQNKTYDFILVTPDVYGEILQQIRGLGVSEKRIKIMVNMPEFTNQRF